MSLNSAEGCFAEIATDPGKLLRIQSRLLQQPQLYNFCAAASAGVSSVPWLLQMQSSLFWTLGHCKSNFDRRKNSFINVLCPISCTSALLKHPLLGMACTASVLFRFHCSACAPWLQRVFGDLSLGSLQGFCSLSAGNVQFIAIAFPSPWLGRGCCLSLSDKKQEPCYHLAVWGFLLSQSAWVRKAQKVLHGAYKLVAALISCPKWLHWLPEEGEKRDIKGSWSLHLDQYLEVMCNKH